MTIGNALLWVVLPAFFLALAVFVRLAFASAEIFRLQRYDFWSRKFYDAAMEIIKHPAAPEDFVSLLSDVNDLICNKRAPMAVLAIYGKRLQAIARGDAPAKRGEEQPREKSEFRRFLEAHPEMVDRADEAVDAGLLTMTYAGWLGGDQARAVLADFLTMSNHGFSASAFSDVKQVGKQAHKSRLRGLVPLISHGRY
jgi:hypothetical protein